LQSSAYCSRRARHHWNRRIYLCRTACTHRNSEKYRGAMSNKNHFDRKTSDFFLRYRTIRKISWVTGALGQIAVDRYDTYQHAKRIRYADLHRSESSGNVSLKRFFSMIKISFAF
jgi:hypothetical protein